MFFKFNIGTFRSCAFDEDSEPQLRSEDAFESETVWTYSFDKFIQYPWVR